MVCDDPCVNSTCEDVLGADRCVADRCGGCIARWYRGDQEVTDQCEGMYGMVYHCHAL